MKTTLLPFAALVLALAGCSGQPTRMAANDAQAAPSRQCDQVTGSRIRGTARGNCESVGYPLRSYSAEDLERSGHIGLGEALRQLDPSFQ